ncbi:MAG: ABC transporter substrate-binding protein [Bryobacteraceae bacterium]
MNRANATLSRRRLLQALPLGALGSCALAKAATTSSPAPIKLAWNANAVCLSPVPLALQKGIFAKHNLNVEFVNYAGSTDQLLEAISTGKADAGVGMILRWLKPLEQGFDVRLVAGTHGGCSRMVGSKKAGVTDVQSLRGKVIATGEVSGPGRNAFSILLLKNGLDPNRDVRWRTFPAPLLGAAVEKGEAQAIADGDPNLYLLEKQSKGDLVEILTNLSAPWQNRVCCVVGVGGHVLRNNRAAATALAASLLEAAGIAAHQPEEAARAFAPYSKASEADLVAILKMQTHNHNPVGANLKQEIALYAGELKVVGIMKPSTDPAKFAEHIFADVFA